MTWADVSSDPVDFDEAIAALRKLVPVNDEAFELLTARAKRRAFKVAGVANLDVVQDIFDAIDDAIANGTDLDDFKETVGEALEAAWKGEVENPGWRLETIFRTNVQRSYAEGRYRQARDPDVLEDRPFWQFDAVIDNSTTDICEECNGTTLDADDPWWLEHQPPLHFNCRSTFITLTHEQALHAGLTDKPTDASSDDGFGVPPPDDPDDDFEPDLSAYDSGLSAEYERQQEDDAPPNPADENEDED